MRGIDQGQIGAQVGSRRLGCGAIEPTADADDDDQLQTLANWRLRLAEARDTSRHARPTLQAGGQGSSPLASPALATTAFAVQSAVQSHCRIEPY